MPPRKLNKEPVFGFRYSVCTLVTDSAEYQQMIDSFINAGFKADECEFIFADNTKGNDFEAFRAINRFLKEARGQYIIICHQDILIEFDDRAILEKRIREIDKLDPAWGVLGNAGANNLFKVSMVVTENGRLQRTGTLPSHVHSLDENFLLVKSEANLAVAGDLSGFHLYGTDICLVAECLGWNCYAIDFNITHKSSGKMNKSFYEISGQLQKKYNRFFRGRYIKTTITRFYLSSSPLISAFMNLGIIKNIVRLYYKSK